MTRHHMGSGDHHERIASSEADVKLSSDRTFGLVFAAFFTVLWMAPAWRGRPVRWWALAVSLLFVLCALTVPRALHSLNLLWAKLAMLLHHVVSPVALALVFFLAFLPMGLLLRALGKDLLRLRRDPQTDSYWIRRDSPGPAPNTMVHQF